MTGAAAIVVMAKAPRPGLAKTRLNALLGADGCAALQAALIRHAARIATTVAPTFVAVTPADSASEVRRLVPPDVTVFAQSGWHLGARMATAVTTVHASTAGPVLVIGTDAPTLDADLLRKAQAVVADGAVVIGPAYDGGYYLIGLPEPIPEAFAIPPALWSGPDVLRATLEALTPAGRTVRLLEPLRDLDTPGDAGPLLAEPALPAPVAAILHAEGRPAWLSA